MNRFSLAVGIFVASMGWATAGLSAEPPSQPSSVERSASPSPSDQCKSLTGQARTECEKTAAKLEQPAEDSSTVGENDPVKVPHHSSPVLNTEKEKAVSKAQREGKDPEKALEKVEEKHPDPVVNPATQEPPTHSDR